MTAGIEHEAALAFLFPLSPTCTAAAQTLSLHTALRRCTLQKSAVHTTFVTPARVSRLWESQSYLLNAKDAFFAAEFVHTYMQAFELSDAYYVKLLSVRPADRYTSTRTLPRSFVSPWILQVRHRKIF